MADSRDEWRLRDRILYPGRGVLVMGIVNVTPDSFSDGGRFAAADAAVAHALELVAARRRPSRHRRRIDPSRRRPRRSRRRTAPRLPGGARIGDAHRPSPVHRHLQSGDGSAGAGGRRPHHQRRHGAARRCRKWRKLCEPLAPGLVLMHMQGTPQTMQQNPAYDDVTSGGGGDSLRRGCRRRRMWV